ncbi:hypothetical protein Sme01_06600 [Sphaerisporangium melleum]|uniref:Major facilitator superfamily (MFS) profile domain-containing protein n=1 Tax=Sphaerisporangium melleum TaxID=321316 RepID=A0A917RMB2_9ACTN|nr:MFS transporter [Sphaerisporangium melleum]GGL14370.1 hypothetical protein GCM10007964_65450 [Sphaerisporangium melleum]GII68184.1 hypothetical protein Sme01_06600 [Sphaerisporangium melleum]
MTPDPDECEESGAPAAGRRVIVIVIVVQLAISIGFFAVMAHLVTHLRHDLGLLAGTIGLVLGLRVAVQYMLFLPAGAITDTIGPGRAGSLACALRAAGFALLGTANGLGGLLVAAVVLAAGGALFHPSAQSLLAGVARARRSRGFAAYLMAGQVGAVAGPPAGLLLLTAGGFGTLAALAVVAWGTAALIFLFLRPARGGTYRAARRTRARDASCPLHAGVRCPAPDRARGAATEARAGNGHLAGSFRRTLATLRTSRSGGPLQRTSAVLRDRRFLIFAATVAPSTLLADQVVTVVPLKEVGGQASTLFFCVVAIATAAVQPWCAAGGRAAERPWVLRSGLLCAGAGYLILLALPPGGIPLAGGPPARVISAGVLPLGVPQGAGAIALLIMAAVLHGLASGLIQAALFQTVTRRAPSGRFGTYFGLLSFLSGAMALVGGLAVGRLFDIGSHGANAALLGLAVVAVLSAAAVRPPGRHAHDRDDPQARHNPQTRRGLHHPQVGHDPQDLRDRHESREGTGANA